MRSRAVIDRTLALLREGYDFLPSRRQRYGADLFQTRLMGQRVICMAGPAAARLLYDESRFERSNALPGIVKKTLVGDGGVQTLDGPQHKRRKAMFMSLMTPEGIATARDRAEVHWQQAIATWPTRRRIVLFDEAARVLLRAGCDWVGVPVRPGEVAERARDMTLMIDGFATVAPRHWRGRRARERSEEWIIGLVRQVRTGALSVADGSPFAVISQHLDVDGQPLDERTVAVEILNLIRPIVAIAWYVAFSMHALHEHPEWRGRLRRGDDAELERFVQEVRRFYPFTPAVGARVREKFKWRGQRFPRGRLVLLDVYGMDHDLSLWDRPQAFDPDRFKDRELGDFEFIPKGEGMSIPAIAAPENA